MYGLLEKQFRSYFAMADRQKGITGTNLLTLLERRFDNVIYRLGFAISRSQARQLVSHNHFLLNGKKVNIPSLLVNVGDVIEVKEKSREVPQIVESLKAVERRGVPQWLEVDKDNFRGTIRLLPSREDITMPIQEHLIVELYSK